MEEKLRFLTFLMMAVGALYIFQGIHNGALTNSTVTGFAIAEQAAPSQPVGCYDTDNRDYFTAGTTYSNLFTANGEGPKQDTCEGNSMIEYYCELGEPQVEFYDCPNGCVSGLCVP